MNTEQQNNGTINFDEAEILRIQVATLIQRVAELENDKSRIHAMLQVLAQQKAAILPNDSGQKDAPK